MLIFLKIKIYNSIKVCKDNVFRVIPAAEIPRFYELCKSWQSWDLKANWSLAAFLGLFPIYVSEDSSTKYCQENKKKYRKKTCGRY